MCQFKHVLYTKKTSNADSNGLLLKWLPLLAKNLSFFIEPKIIDLTNSL